MLDFSLLTRLDYRELFVRLPDEVEKAIDVLPETSARFLAALRFCWYISATTDVLFAQEPKATRLREAFLRASLAEYVSIEDTLKRDLRRLNIATQPTKIFNLENPLLHIMRVMRNLEIHLTSAQLSHSKKDVVIVVSEAEHQSQTTIWTVDDLTVEKFKRPYKVKDNYTESEIELMVKWFNEAQYDWGVNHLLFRAISEWASAIVQRYSLNNCLTGSSS
jgi:hypothetical protein